ncbi:MAG: universal stress protein [Cyclobacteriaceae bacterium]|nr:universal stress protein [Cyclobacteriaceae bacterium]
MKTILVPIDFQHASGKALTYIERVFKDQSIRMELLHVSTPAEKSTKEEIQKLFEKFEFEFLKNCRIPYSLTIATGGLLEEIQKNINEKHPSLVVIGLTGNTLVKALVKLMNCPVLIIPSNNETPSIRNIVYANDFHSIKDSSALEPLWNLAQACDAMVHVLHVTREDVLPKDESEGPLEYYLDHIKHEYVSLKSDDFVAAINNYAADKKIDLLTLMIRDHGKNELQSGGQLVEQLLTETNIPVLNLV